MKMSNPIAHRNDQAIHADDRGLVELRSKICDYLLLTMALISAPLLCVSLLRSLDTGWQPLFFFHIAIVLMLWALWVFRHRVPYEVRSYFSIAFQGAVALVGLYIYGVTAAAGAWIIGSAISATVLQGQRVGIFVLLTLLLTAVILATSFITGLLVPQIIVEAPSTTVIQWALYLLSWFFLGVTTVMAVGYINQYFWETLKQLATKSNALEESQFEYIDLFENVADVIYRADLDGKITRISPSSLEGLGFSPEEMIGTMLADYYVDQNKRSELEAELQENEGIVTNFEAQLFAKNGEPQWVSTNVRYWKDKDGTVIGLQGVARNINELKNTDEALRRSQKMDALGQLSGGIAHDFNNVLSIILGNAEIVRTDAKNIEDTKQPIAEIVKSIEHAASLTKRLLAFSRPDRLEPQPCEIDQVISNIEEMLRRTLGANITLSFSLGCNGAVALVDENQLEASLFNLAINASDAMPNGGELMIQTKKVSTGLSEAKDAGSPDATDLICISVQDTGKGMPEDIAAKALEPFFTTKPLGMGNGLGLSMVYQFVSESRGDLSIQSKLRDGTNVTLTLPQTDVKLNTSSLNVEVNSELRKPKVRILLVEDSVSLLTLVQRQLKNENFEVLTATNGQEALEFIRQDSKIDVIFSDIMLPGGVSGFDICREARKIRSDFKVLLTTGYTQNTPNEIDALAKAPILYKPFSREDLLTRLAEIIAEPTPSTREL
ncbi:MAG TPA: response regulator [Gammaproteobacteria bacterium]|nr:response regulator [Gammaproteobacteria bacterium]